VASWGAGRLDAFAVDQATGRLLQRTFEGGVWSGWADRDRVPRCSSDWAGRRGCRVPEPRSADGSPRPDGPPGRPTV